MENISPTIIQWLESLRILGQTIFINTPLQDSPLLQGLTAYVFLLWCASVIWVVKDITNRTQNILFQTFSILLPICFTPFFGIPLYILLRPRLTIFERYYEEVESALELKTLEQTICQHCSHPLESSYHYCPNCRAEVAKPCVSCGRYGALSWKFCPYCGWDALQPRPETKFVVQETKKQEKKTQQNVEAVIESAPTE